MATDRSERIYSDLPIPPGELLAEELDVRGMSQKELADRTGRPEQTVSEIINGKKGITHDTALELEKVLGIPASFWVNLEGSFQLTKARLRDLNELDRQEDWLGFFPVREMKQRDLVPKTTDKREILTALLKFFGVASFTALKQRQEAILGYRITPKSTVSLGALWTWLREGEVQALEIDTEPYDEDRFREALEEIRSITTQQKPREFIQQMSEICASAGVAFVVTKEYPKSGASGVARWLSPDMAMIQLSTKRRFCDMFWFSFFHEAKHVLDRQRRRIFVNGINDEPVSEDAANKFAADTLIPPSAWASFVATQTWSHVGVAQFAQRLGIHPEIIVGRMQHEKVIPPNFLNDMRRRFMWSDD